MRWSFRAPVSVHPFRPNPCAVEPLEGRCLLSAAGDGDLTLPPSPPPPVVRMMGRSIVTAGSSHTFSLVFSAAPGIDASTFAASDVKVTGPNGFDATPRVTRLARSADGRLMIATCQVAAPGGLFDATDNGAYAVSLAPDAVADLAGTTTPGGVVGRFRVYARRMPAATGAADIPTRASAGALTAELTQVYAWCDHMPSWPEQRRQYLVLHTVLTNTSDAPLEVRLDRAYLSFDASQLGTPTDGVSVMSPHGPPSGEKVVVLQPGESRAVRFRGNGLYPEDSHGKRLYVTLEFSAAGQTARVRNSDIVKITW